MRQISLKLYLIIFCFFLFGYAKAQISLEETNISISENFDSMGTDYPTGWSAVKYTGSSSAVADGRILVMALSSGTSNSGNIYSLGENSSTERSFGSLASGGITPRFGAGFVNNTGSVITQINLKGVMEQWRSGSLATVDEVLTFEYSLNATCINDPTAIWTPLPSFDILEKLINSTSAGALNGNDTTNQRGMEASISDIEINPNATLWIRWTDADNTGSDGIYAIDSFGLTPIGYIPPNPNLSTSITPLSDFNFGITEIAVPTAAKHFTFYAADLQDDITISTSKDYEISKDNLSFGSSISYDKADAAIKNKVYVRYHPKIASSDDNIGSITFFSADINISRGFLTGSTIPKEKTLNVVTWNVEWFGNKSLGPKDEAAQLKNAKTLMDSLQADIYALEEISNPNAFHNLVKQLPGYKGILSPYGSSPNDSTSQRIAFIYKTSVIDSISSKGLLTGAAATGLPGYPVDPSRFWSSGRFPFVFEVDAMKNGAVKRLYLVGIHPKANENDTPENSNSAYLRRKYDVKVLKDTLDKYYPKVSIIMLGDYNDDVDSTVANIPSRISTFSDFVTDSTNYKVVTKQLSNAGLRTYITFDNVIDHITISNELFKDYVNNSSRIIIPFAILPDYEESTSDHLPVMARFSLINESSIINFEGRNADVKENAGSVVINLKLDKAASKDESVSIKVSNGTGANYGFYGDYTTAPEVISEHINLVVPKDSLGVSFTVILNKDFLNEAPENIFFTLSNTSNGLVKGNDSTFQIRLINENPVGVVKDVFNSLFSIYPLPTKGPVTIKFPSKINENTPIVLLIASLNLGITHTFTGNTIQVNAQLNQLLLTLTQGFYFVKLVAGKDVYYSKLIKN